MLLVKVQVPSSLYLNAMTTVAPFSSAAREHHIAFNSREDLCQNEQIHEMMMERIDTLQQQLAHYEQIKRFTLLPHAFSMERGELTNTLKIKRRVLNENYKAQIDKMYEE